MKLIDDPRKVKLAGEKLCNILSVFLNQKSIASLMAKRKIISVYDFYSEMSTIVTVDEVNDASSRVGRNFSFCIAQTSMRVAE